MDEKQMMRKLNDKYPNIVRQIYKFSNDKKIFSVDDAFTLYNALNYCDNNKINISSIELIIKNNITNLEQISEILKGQKNGLSKSKIRIFALPHFNQKQMEQIRLALEHGVSNKKILIIANPKNDAEKMEFLRKNIECKIDGIDIENDSLDILKKNFEQYIKNIKLDDILSDKISIPQEDKAVFLKENNKNILNEILFAYQSGILNKFKHFLNKGFSGFQLQEIRRALEHNLINSDISLILTVNNHEDIQKIRKILEAKNLIKYEKSIKFLNSIIDGYKNNIYNFESFITIANEEIISKLGECYDLTVPEKIHTEKEMNKKQKAFFSDMLTEYSPEELELFKKCKSSIQMEQVEDGLKRKIPLDLIEKYIGFNRDKMLEIKLSILGLLATLKSKNYSNYEAYQIIKNSIHLIANENLTVDDMRKVREDYVKGSSEVDIITKYSHLYSRNKNTQESKCNEIIK